VEKAVATRAHGRIPYGFVSKAEGKAVLLRDISVEKAGKILPFGDVYISKIRSKKQENKNKNYSQIASKIIKNR